MTKVKKNAKKSEKREDSKNGKTDFLLTSSSVNGSLLSLSAVPCADPPMPPPLLLWLPCWWWLRTPAPPPAPMPTSTDPAILPALDGRASSLDSRFLCQNKKTLIVRVVRKWKYHNNQHSSQVEMMIPPQQGFRNKLKSADWNFFQGK